MHKQFDLTHLSDSIQFRMSFFLYFSVCCSFNFKPNRIIDTLTMFFFSFLKSPPHYYILYHNLHPTFLRVHSFEIFVKKRDIIIKINFIITFHNLFFYIHECMSPFIITYLDFTKS